MCRCRLGLTHRVQRGEPRCLGRCPLEGAREGRGAQDPHGRRGLPGDTAIDRLDAAVLWLHRALIRVGTIPVDDS